MKFLFLFSNNVYHNLILPFQFEQLHPTLMIKGYEQSKIIYVDLTRKLEEDKDGILHESDVKDAMKQYGVVRSCKKTEDRSCKKTEKRSWYKS